MSAGKYTYGPIEISQETNSYSIVGKSEEAESIVSQYVILDPDGDQIAVVLSETEAEILVSHLNR